jgi:hypothetical protein
MDCVRIRETEGDHEVSSSAEIRKTIPNAANPAHQKSAKAMAEITTARLASVGIRAT